MPEIITRRHARAIGTRRYFTGKPCGRGHVAERFTDSANCTECVWHYNRTAGRRAVHAAYNKTPAGRAAQAKTRSSTAHRERYERDKRDGKVAAWSRRHYLTGRKAVTKDAWEKRNRHRTAAWCALYSAAKIRATPPWLTREMRAQIEAVYKLAADQGVTVDHIVPLRGKNVCGLHVPWNLQPLSRPQNSRKGNRLDV